MARSYELTYSSNFSLNRNNGKEPRSPFEGPSWKYGQGASYGLGEEKKSMVEDQSENGIIMERKGNQKLQ